jgi:hypothetical protein
MVNRQESATDYIGSELCDGEAVNQSRVVASA